MNNNAQYNSLQGEITLAKTQSYTLTFLGLIMVVLMLAFAPIGWFDKGLVVLSFIVINLLFEIGLGWKRLSRIQMDDKGIKLLFGRSFTLHSIYIPNKLVTAVGYKDKYKLSKNKRFIKIFLDNEEKKVMLTSAYEVSEIIGYYIKKNKSLIIDTKNPIILKQMAA